MTLLRAIYKAAHQLDHNQPVPAETLTRLTKALWHELIILNSAKLQTEYQFLIDNANGFLKSALVQQTLIEQMLIKPHSFNMQLLGLLQPSSGLSVLNFNKLLVQLCTQLKPNSFSPRPILEFLSQPWVIRALGKIQQPTAVSKLILYALAEPDFKLRQLARLILKQLYENLGLIGREGLVNLLKQNYIQAKACQASIEELASIVPELKHSRIYMGWLQTKFIGNKSSLPMLLDQLKANDPSLRQAACLVLADYAARDPKLAHAKLLDLFLELTRDSSEAVRKAAYKAIASLITSQPVLATETVLQTIVDSMIANKTNPLSNCSCVALDTIEILLIEQPRLLSKTIILPIKSNFCQRAERENKNWLSRFLANNLLRFILTHLLAKMKTCLTQPRDNCKSYQLAHEKLIALLELMPEISPDISNKLPLAEPFRKLLQNTDESAEALKVFIENFCVMLESQPTAGVKKAAGNILWALLLAYPSQAPKLLNIILDKRYDYRYYDQFFQAIGNLLPLNSAVASLDLFKRLINEWSLNDLLKHQPVLNQLLNTLSSSAPELINQLAAEQLAALKQNPDLEHQIIICRTLCIFIKAKPEIVCLELVDAIINLVDPSCIYEFWQTLLAIITTNSALVSIEILAEKVDSVIEIASQQINGTVFEPFILCDDAFMFITELLITKPELASLTRLEPIIKLIESRTKQKASYILAWGALRILFTKIPLLASTDITARIINAFIALPSEQSFEINDKAFKTVLSLVKVNPEFIDEKLLVYLIGKLEDSYSASENLLVLLKIKPELASLKLLESFITTDYSKNVLKEVIAVACYITRLLFIANPAQITPTLLTNLFQFAAGHYTDPELLALCRQITRSNSQLIRYLPVTYACLMYAELVNIQKPATTAIIDPGFLWAELESELLQAGCTKLTQAELHRFLANEPTATELRAPVIGLLVLAYQDDEYLAELISDLIGLPLLGAYRCSLLAKVLVKNEVAVLSGTKERIAASVLAYLNKQPLTEDLLHFIALLQLDSPSLLVALLQRFCQSQDKLIQQAIIECFLLLERFTKHQVPIGQLNPSQLEQLLNFSEQNEDANSILSVLKFFDLANLAPTTPVSKRLAALFQGLEQNEQELIVNQMPSWLKPSLLETSSRFRLFTHSNAQQQDDLAPTASISPSMA